MLDRHCVSAFSLIGDRTRLSGGSLCCPCKLDSNAEVHLVLRTYGNTLQVEVLRKVAEYMSEGGKRDSLEQV